MTFEIALTGLNAASSDLEIISNNIANAATIGFKRSDITFGDVYGSTGLGTTGNPIGQGVRITDVSQQFAQGDVTFTENQLDLSISGEGFFRLSDNGSTMYTRAGSFGLDREGYIVNGMGQRLTGYPADEEGRITPIAEDLRLNAIDSSPQQTGSLNISMNLDAKSTVTEAFDATDSETYNFSTSASVYDSLGSSHLATMYFRKTSENEWSVHSFVGDKEISQVNGDTLTFSTEGELTNINGGDIGLAMSETFVPAPGTSPMSIELNFSQITQYDSPFGVNEVLQKGYNAGRLNDFDIDADGTIYGHYTNGESRAMGQVTLTNFRNSQGLQQVGNTNWMETHASGDAVTGISGTASLGGIQASSLEEANVDLTAELVKMIGTQRNFQANAQVISASDTLTQTVMNIRR